MVSKINHLLAKQCALNTALEWINCEFSLFLQSRTDAQHHHDSTSPKFIHFSFLPSLDIEIKNRICFKKSKIKPCPLQRDMVLHTCVALFIRSIVTKQASGQSLSFPDSFGCFLSWLLSQHTLCDCSINWLSMQVFLQFNIEVIVLGQN